jgi:hypothetical protein
MTEQKYLAVDGKVFDVSSLDTEDIRSIRLDYLCNLRNSFIFHTVTNEPIEPISNSYAYKKLNDGTCQTPIEVEAALAAYRRQRCLETMWEHPNWNALMNTWSELMKDGEWT